MQGLKMLRKLADVFLYSFCLDAVVSLSLDFLTSDKVASDMVIAAIGTFMMYPLLFRVDTNWVIVLKGVQEDLMDADRSGYLQAHYTATSLDTSSHWRFIGILLPIGFFSINPQVFTTTHVLGIGIIWMMLVIGFEIFLLLGKAEIRKELAASGLSL